MITEEVKDDLLELVKGLQKDFHLNCTEVDDGDEPYIELTCATDDGEQWNYQTGDNSFTGGAYGLKHWAVVTILRNSKPSEIVEDIISEWEELMSYEH